MITQGMPESRYNMNPDSPPLCSPWLDQGDYAKAVGQLRLQVGAVFTPFAMYGQDVLIPGAVREIVKLCEDFGLRVRGVDQAISLERIRRK